VLPLIICFSLLTLFLLQFGILKNHFYHLMNIDGETVGLKMNKTCPEFLKFFEAEGNKKRKGEADTICQKLRQILFDFGNRPKTPELEFVALILCVAAKLNQDLSHLFLYFEVVLSCSNYPIKTLVSTRTSYFIAFCVCRILPVTMKFRLLQSCPRMGGPLLLY